MRDDTHVAKFVGNLFAATGKEIIDKGVNIGELTPRLLNTFTCYRWDPSPAEKKIRKWESERRFFSEKHKGVMCRLCVPLNLLAPAWTQNITKGLTEGCLSRLALFSICLIYTNTE